MSPLSDDPTRRILTPSMLNAEAQITLEERFGLVWIEGELSNFSRPASGHWYFTLKDRTAQVRCAMFKGRNTRVPFTPEAGGRLLLRARVSLYTGRGEFQLIVESMEPAGEGALRLAFEQLRRRLADEGLFDDARKRPLPAAPHRIALITSPSGAAVRDLLTVLGRRWPLAEIVLLPSAVQGEAAPAELIAAFRHIERMCGTPEFAPDVAITGRGGGSLEDLWCFNDEGVARSIAACPVPVISAVGHETDFTIADFVADLRAPTPSAAAELATPDASAWQRRLISLSRAMTLAQRRQLDAVETALAARRARLRDPATLIAERTQRVDELGLRLERQQHARMARRSEQLRNLARRLRTLSPRARLSRGKDALSALQRRLTQLDPRRETARRALAINALERRLSAAMARRDALARSELDRMSRALQALSPLGVVERGYAILARPAEEDARFGEVLKRARDAEIGERLTAQLAEGRIQVEVREIDIEADPDAEVSVSAS